MAEHNSMRRLASVSFEDVERGASLRSQNFEVVRTRHGDLRVYSSNDLVSDFLKHFGEWSWLEIQFVAAQLPPNARILDVGAYLGTFGLGLSKVVDLDYACFVEPSATTFSALSENVHDAGIVATCLNVALADTNGKFFSVTDEFNFGHTIWKPWPPETPEAQKAEIASSLRLSEVVQQFGPFDLIKMDIEGSELSVLNDSDFVLLDGQALWLEANRTRETRYLVNFLLERNFHITYVAWPAQNPAALRMAETPLIPLTYEAGLYVTKYPRELRGMTNSQFDSLIVHAIRNISDLFIAQHRTPHGAPHFLQELNRPQLIGLACSTTPIEGHLEDDVNCDTCADHRRTQDEPRQAFHATLLRLSRSHRNYSTDTGIRLERLSTELAIASGEIALLRMETQKLRTSLSFRLGRRIVRTLSKIPGSRQIYRTFRRARANRTR